MGKHLLQRMQLKTAFLNILQSNAFIKGKPPYLCTYQRRHTSQISCFLCDVMAQGTHIGSGAAADPKLQLLRIQRFNIIYGYLTLWTRYCYPFPCIFIKLSSVHPDTGYHRRYLLLYTAKAVQNRLEIRNRLYRRLAEETQRIGATYFTLGAVEDAEGVFERG